MLYDPSKQPHRDQSAAERNAYKPIVKARVMKALSDDDFCRVSGAQATEDWSLMRFGRLASTEAVRTIALRSSTPKVQTDVSCAEAIVQSSGLLQ